jgi:hypothetical protein
MQLDIVSAKNGKKKLSMRSQAAKTHRSAGSR